MGIGIVLIFWGVVGLLGATIGSAILPRIASYFTQGRVRRLHLDGEKGLHRQAGSVFSFHLLLHKGERTTTGPAQPVPLFGLQARNVARDFVLVENLPYLRQKARQFAGELRPLLGGDA